MRGRVGCLYAAGLLTLETWKGFPSEAEERSDPPLVKIKPVNTIVFFPSVVLTLRNEEEWIILGSVGSFLYY